MRAYVEARRRELAARREDTGRILRSARRPRNLLTSTHHYHGQLHAGAALLALTGRDLEPGGRFGEVAANYGVFELYTFTSELRELHLRVREAAMPRVHAIRLPRALLETGDRSAGETRADTVVVLSAAHVRRYRALMDEAEAVFLRADAEREAHELFDLTVRAVDAATEALELYERRGATDGAAVRDARRRAADAVRTAKRVKDAVTLHRVKRAPTLEAGDTLWYELSSAPSINSFNTSRKSHEGEDRRAEPDAPRNFDDICLWPSDGLGREAAVARRQRRYRRTTGLLQKLTQEPVRDRRGLANLYEVRYIDARLLLDDGKTALMYCAREADFVMVGLLLDGVDVPARKPVDAAFASRGRRTAV